MLFACVYEESELKSKSLMPSSFCGPCLVLIPSRTSWMTTARRLFSHWHLSCSLGYHSPHKSTHSNSYTHSSSSSNHSQRHRNSCRRSSKHSKRHSSCNICTTGQARPRGAAQGSLCSPAYGEAVLKVRCLMQDTCMHKAPLQRAAFGCVCKSLA